jgi:hypothetical protein
MTIWPPIIILMLMALSFGINCAKAGQSRPAYSPVADLVGSAITGAILYWGGFFEPLLR